MSTKSNLGASVTARLLNRARATGDDYQILLAAYCFERLLYRVGASGIRDRFVLKGAMLLRVWSERPYRATRDLDLLRRGEGSVDAILDDLREVLRTPTDPDGVTFDAASIELVPIRADGEHVGTRVALRASCGTARIGLQIDLGVGDAVWPPPKRCAYPTLLDFPAPDVLAYPREAVVAEKLEAMIVLGDRNSRIKDFFDVHYLASSFPFDRQTLAEAVRRTFARRGTPIPTSDPIALTSAYWENPSRPTQIRAFAKRARLRPPESPGDELGGPLRTFLLPIFEDLRAERSREGSWKPGGPWR